MESRYSKYLKKRDGEELAASEAQDKSDTFGDYADLGASLINKFQDGQQGETQFAPNTIANLGKKHIATEQYKAPDVSSEGVKSIWARDAAKAKDKVAKTDERFNKETAMNETKKKEDQDDPNSSDSRKARIAYKAALMKEVDVARAAGKEEAAQRLLDSYDDTTSANQAYKNLAALKAGSYEDMLKSKEDSEKQDKGIKAQYGLQAQNNAFQTQRDKTKFDYDVELEKLKPPKEPKQNWEATRVEMSMKDDYDANTADFNKDLIVGEKMDGFVASAKSGNQEAISQLKYLAARLTNGPGVLTDTDMKQSSINQAWVDKYKAWVSSGATGEVTAEELAAYNRIGQAAKKKAIENIQGIQKKYSAVAKKKGLDEDVIFMGQKSFEEPKKAAPLLDDNTMSELEELEAWEAARNGGK